MDEFVSLLQKGIAEEIEAQRLYAALAVVAPESEKAQLLEIFKDESDHNAILTDMLARYAGYEGEVQRELGDVE